MRPAAGGRTAEVEDGAAVLDRPLERAPVEQHVRRRAVEAPVGRRPDHLGDAAAPMEPPGGDGFAAAAHDDERRLVRKRRGEPPEERLAVDRRAVLAPLARQQAMELRHQFRAADRRRHPFLRRPFHLGPQLGAEPAPEFVGRGGKRQPRADLGRRRRQRQRRLGRLAQLSEARPLRAQRVRGGREQRVARLVVGGGEAGVVDEGEREQAAAEQRVGLRDQRQHADDLAARERRERAPRKPELGGQQVPPRPTLVARRFRAGPHEAVPRGRVGLRGAPDDHAHRRRRRARTSS